MSSGIAMGVNLINGIVNKFNYFAIQTKNPSGLLISIDGPSTPVIRYNVNESSIDVEYKVDKEGIYIMSITQSGIPLRGSPFRILVGPSPLHYISSKKFDDDVEFVFDPSPFGDVSKVVTSGRGLHLGLTNVQSEIICDTRKAGLGRIRWTMEGDRNGKICLRHLNIVSGLHKLYYKVDTSGLYLAHIYFNEQEVPGSPFKIRIM